MEAGYSEKVDELCERYCLEGFSKVSGDKYSRKTCYLKIIWNSLRFLMFSVLINFTSVTVLGNSLSLILTYPLMYCKGNQ